MLSAYGDRQHNGSHTYKEELVRKIWQGATEGQVEFPNNLLLRLSPRDWQQIAMWIFNQIDGPPRQEIDINPDGDKPAPSPQELQAFVKAYTAHVNAQEAAQANTSRPDGD